MSLGNEAIGKLVFVDSYKFQADSLERLIETQLSYEPTPEAAFPLVAELHPWGDKLDLILQKIPFPYNALAAPPKTWSRMPAVLEQEAYDNKLRRTTCSLPEYERIQALAADVGLTSFMSYHCCYLWTDVLALADIMERFSAEWHDNQSRRLYTPPCLVCT